MTMTRDRGSMRFHFGRKSCCSLFCFLLVFSVLALYVTYFRHPPPDELLIMNSHNYLKDTDSHIDFKAKIKQAKISGKKQIEKDLSLKQPQGIPSSLKDMDANGDRSKASIKPEVTANKVQGSSIWAKYIKDNKLVSIGEVFNTCEGANKVMIGQVVMLPDVKFGGVMARTFMNFTTAYNVTGGEFYIDVKYNNKDLYDNHWDLCELSERDQTEEEEQNHQLLVTCPLNSGYHTITQDGHIPAYLPKGKYETNVWMTDQTDEIFLCGRCIFVL